MFNIPHYLGVITLKPAKETLIAHVSLRTLYRWGHEYLQPEVLSKVSHNNDVSVATWQQDLKQVVEGKECESCVEAYEIEKIRAGFYTYDYLQMVCCWLHETLELNCRGK